QNPVWSFGEGLSYTTVEYSDLQVEKAELAEPDMIRASVVLSNTGDRSVRETVQVYVRDEYTSVSWTDKELKSFVQVDLAPGQVERVLIEVPVAECSIVNSAGKRVVEPGLF